MTGLDRLLGFGLSVGLVCGCNQPAASQPEREVADAPTPTRTPTPVEPSPVAQARVAQPGFAYLGVDSVGVYRLDDDGLHLHVPSRSPIVDLVALEPELLMLGSFGVQRVTAANQSETVAEIDRTIAQQLGSLVALGSVDGRQLWVAGREGVGRFDGAWTITALAELGGAAATAPIDLAVDAAGIPWLQHGALHRYVQPSWQPLELPASPIALGPDARSGAMFLHLGCGGDPNTCTLMRHHDDVAKTSVAGAGDCRELPALALSSDGTRAVLGGRCGLLRLGLDTPELTAELLPARIDGWTGQPLHSLAIDDSGRIWLGTNDGLTLVDPGPEPSVHEFTIGELVEMSGAITNLIVVGKGPPAPARGQVRTGGIKATIVTEVAGVNQPHPGVKVELCSRLPIGGELPPDPARSPCAGVEPTHVAVTDTEGTFVIESLPISGYYVGAEIDGRWARGVPKALHMRAGMTGNVGKILVAVPD